MKKIFAVMALQAAAMLHGQANIIVSEVAPWSSGNSSLGADWFELTNTGAGALDITGWKVDDSSNSFGSAVALSGITSIAPGESVIFLESSSSLATQFKSLWFGANAPAGLQVGNYSGSGIGLSTSGDAVNIFNSGGALQASVTFGTASSGPLFATFDNGIGLNGTSVSLFSGEGVNGAFIAANGPGEVGSPGAIPEPSTWAMIGIGLAGVVIFRRRLVRG